MKRRHFLLWSAVLGASPYLQGGSLKSMDKRLAAVTPTLAAVQMHLFPERTALPSAREMHVTEFLLHTITHSTYDKDIRLFVIEGAEELMSREKGAFAKMNHAQKEAALRRFEQTTYGENWLARMLTLGMEALFSDPIYGSNINQKGWKAIDSYGASPRPKQPYLGVRDV